MKTALVALLAAVTASARSRGAMQLEILALRHQLAVYQRGTRRPRLTPADRLLWVWLARVWSGWRDVIVFVKPETVVAWQRRRFREHWAGLSRRGTLGRPRVAREVRDLIRRMSSANPLWGSPRILGELRKVGIELSKSTVEKYMSRPLKPASPTWRAFLKYHTAELVSTDFFVVPTIRFTVLYVFLVLAHDRRRVIHWGVTEHPTAGWTAQQVVEAFPWDEAPRFLLRDRDCIYGGEFKRRVRNMGIQQVLIAPRSPWQNPFVERLIGSIRRECLDHVVVFDTAHLRRLLSGYFSYYHRSRTHQSLDMDCPDPRPVQQPELGQAVVAIPQVGGLHHRYERRAA
jgi:transposase InsO family protein